MLRWDKLRVPRSSLQLWHHANKFAPSERETYGIIWSYPCLYKSYVIDLCPRKALYIYSMLRLLCRLPLYSLVTSLSFTQIILLLGLHWVNSDLRAHHSTNQPFVKSDFYIDSKCVFIWYYFGLLPHLILQCIYQYITSCIYQYIRSYDDSSLLARFVELYKVIILRYPLINMCCSLHIILSLDNWDLFLLDICHVRVIFLFTSFPLEVSKTIILLYYFVLLNKLCIIPPLWTHLLDYDFSSI